MPRPCCCRRVAGKPPSGLFKPAGVPCRSLEEIVLALDELEAVRLADLEGLYQEQAAARMNVSRQTFARIVESARNKVARALVEGKALRIEGGVIEMAAMRTFTCTECKKEWEVPYGTGRPRACPECGSLNFHRCAEDRGGLGRRGGRGPGGGPGRCFHGGRGASSVQPAAPKQAEPERSKT
jgi:uncharacterized protein